ncbi:NAD-dependent epimerase/dehydratase family protein [Baekduia sp. Peel2402]|uniref:NAD-dependent epimerase/dehydratase family protein n=1 Tax=Baekduia sp. Peel2402 TaxID=3458296 RepID=UPI00403ED892
MRVFLAGATGAIGRPLAERLLAEGHEVVGTTRDEARAAVLARRGVEPVVLDAFDAPAVHAAVATARPEVVIHQLTTLPQDPTPKSMAAAVSLNARLRRETVPTYVDAARAAGARRVIAQSISFVTKPDGRPVHDEEAPLWADEPSQAENVEGVIALEAAVREGTTDPTHPIEGVVMRYGFFYGPGTWYAPDGALATMIRKRRYPIVGSGEGRSSFIHIDDAVDATVRALDPALPSGTYNITDDEPVRAADWIPEAARVMGAKPPRHVPAWLARRVAGDVVVHYGTTLPGNANGRARAAIPGWAPRPWRQGFAEVLG